MGSPVFLHTLHWQARLLRMHYTVLCPLPPESLAIAPLLLSLCIHVYLCVGHGDVGFALKYTLTVPSLYPVHPNFARSIQHTAALLHVEPLYPAEAY